MKSKLILCSSLVLVGAIDVRAMDDIRDFRHSWRKGQQIQRSEYSSESDNERQPLKSPYSTDNKAIPIQQTKQNNFLDDNNEYDYYSNDNSNKNDDSKKEIKNQEDKFLSESSDFEESKNKKTNSRINDLSISAQNSDFEPIQKGNQKIEEEEEEFEYNNTSNDQRFNDENKQNQSSDKEYDNFNDSRNSTQNRKAKLYFNQDNLNQEEVKSQSEKDDNQYSDHEDQNSYKERDNFNDSRNSTRSKKAESFRRSIPLAVNDEFGQNEYSDHYDNFNDLKNPTQNRKDNLINQEEVKSQSEKSDNEDQNSYKERDHLNDSRSSTRSKKAKSFFNKEEQEEIELSKNNQNQSNGNISQECDLPVTEAHWYDKPVAWIKSSWNYCYYSWPVQRYVVRPFKSAVKEFSGWLLGDDIAKEAEKKANEKIAGKTKLLYEQIREIAAGQQQDQQEMSEVEDDVDAQLDAVSRQLSLVRKRDVNELLGRVEDLEQNIENEKRNLSDKSLQLDKKVDAINQRILEYQDNTNSVIQEAFKKQRKKLHHGDEQQNHIEQELDTQKQAISGYGEELSRLNQVVNEVSGRESEYAEQIQQINELNKCFKHEIKKLKAQQVEQQDLLTRVNELTSSLTQVINAYNSMKSFVTGMGEKLNVLSSHFEGASDFSILGLAQRIEEIEVQMQNLMEQQQPITLEDPQAQAFEESVQKRSAEIENKDGNNEPQLLNVEDLASDISGVNTSDLSMNSSANKSSKKRSSSKRQKKENDVELDDSELASSSKKSKNQQRGSTLSKNAQFNENEQQQEEQKRRKRRHNKNKDQETDNENNVNQYDNNLADD